VTPMCYVAPDGSWRYILVPKCGCTSVLAAMYGLVGTPKAIHRQVRSVYGIGVPWTPEGPPTVAVVRSPLDRLSSTWMNKVRQPHRPDTSLIAHYGLRQGMTFPAFVERVAEAGVRGLDSHVRPQVDFLPDDPSRVALVRLRELAEGLLRTGVVPRSTVRALKHRNRSGIVLDPYTAELETRVMEMYDEDMALWNGLTT